MADSLGARLHQKREALGLSLEDVEGRICIRARHLRAIESDDLSEFASTVQAKGFIRTYALFLDVPFEPITHPVGAARPAATAPTILLPLSVEEVPPPKRQVPYDGMPKTVAGPRRALTRWLRMEVLVIVMTAVMVFGLFAWGVNKMIETAFTTPSPTVTPQIAATATLSNFEASQTMLSSVVASLSASPSLVPTGLAGVPSTPRPTAYPTPQGGIYTTVHVRIQVLQSAFLKVTVDDVEAFSQRVAEGDSFEFDGKRMVSVSTGNGAGLRVNYNGVDQGILGNFGELDIRTWNLSGLVQATLAPAATPKSTPPGSPSVTPAR
jgi:cytoskeleton protein RodZ